MMKDRLFGIKGDRVSIACFPNGDIHLGLEKCNDSCVLSSGSAMNLASYIIQLVGKHKNGKECDE